MALCGGPRWQHLNVMRHYPSDAVKRADSHTGRGNGFYLLWVQPEEGGSFVVYDAGNLRFARISESGHFVETWQVPFGEQPDAPEGACAPNALRCLTERASALSRAHLPVRRWINARLPHHTKRTMVATFVTCRHSAR